MGGRFHLTEKTGVRRVGPPRLQIVQQGHTAIQRCTPEPPDDFAIVAAMRRNDESAAGAFHDRVLPQIENTIFRLLGGRDADHDDLVQSSLVELIRSIGRFRGDCSLGTWAGTITAHVVWKHLRRRGREASVFRSGSSNVVDLTAPGSGPARDAVLRGLVGRVRGHLAKLAPDKAWAFLLHDVCGYEVDETARIMNVSRAAAQARVSRGRRELHALIRDDPELAGWISEAKE